MSNASSKRPLGAKTGVKVKMFKRKPKTEVVVQAAPAQLPSTDVMGQLMQRMAGELIASTALSRIQSDVGAMARDFRDFKDNIARLNSELGVFREKVIVPVKEELQYIRYNLGARSDDTVGSMQKLVHHLEAQLELLLKAQGVNPHQRDSVGETPLDRMGVSPNRPDYQTLEREGVQIVETGNAGADLVSMQQGQIEKLRGSVERLEHENTELRRLTLETGVVGPPEIPFKRGDYWVDSLQRRWAYMPAES